MRMLLTLLTLATLTFALDLNSLLNSVKMDSNKELQAEQQRLEHFIKNKEAQKKLLVQTKTDLKKEEQRTVKLKSIIEQKEKELIKQEALLKVKAASLGEMFGSVRQTSSDFLINYQSSLTASQQSTKEELFTQMANSKKLPNMSELKNFWHGMLDEIIQSGKIAQYPSDVILNSGEKNNQLVTRIGLFTAVSQGEYFTYSNDMKSLVALNVQPPNSMQNLAQEFEQSSEVSNLIIDPTRGTLLQMIENNPTLTQRIQQGGVVGYIILVLGCLGLLFAVYKMVLLNMASKKIKKQMNNISHIDENNSLGKIAKVFYKNMNDNINDLEIKIEQAILKETNQIKKGQSFVKVLSAVTPLLGLLGTVTGMIATFQAITLFGTGDPKLMAGGISTALVTTVLGLVTAIPLLFSYTYISSKADELVSILEEQSIGLLAKTLK